MKIHLAGFLTGGKGDLEMMKETKPPFVLESFYELRKNKRFQILLEYAFSPHCKSFMLDSGAFTFMENTDRVDFDKYLNNYIKFINEYDVDKFFELDIDSVVGTEKVRILRERLEKGTGKKSIPVWHKCRGKENFQRLCSKYNYVAIGGIVSGEFKKSEYKYFHWFIREAHKRNTKIHGLGFTDPKKLESFHWDSVDSTSWLGARRFGRYMQFRGARPIQKTAPEGYRLNGKKAVKHNLKSWINFSKKLDNGSMQKPAK